MKDIILFVDDVREPPSRFTHRVYTASDAITLLETGDVIEISLDHDLGDNDEDGTGYEVACWIERESYLGNLDRIKWSIHSANPVGVENIRKALLNADRYWEMRNGNTER